MRTPGIALPALAALLVTGCREEGGAEKLGKELDEAIDGAQKEMERD
jgi:hypothetical protein